MNNLVSVLLIISSITTIVIFLVAAESLLKYAKPKKTIFLFISFMWLFSDEIFTEEAQPHLKKERKLVMYSALITLGLFFIERLL